jgi:hypothetical protein
MRGCSLGGGLITTNQPQLPSLLTFNMRAVESTGGEELQYRPSSSFLQKELICYIQVCPLLFSLTLLYHKVFSSVVSAI